jgi:NAD(P)-dependent dehydrogenase (short-subunit alcohol dehydrogenase family)
VQGDVTVQETWDQASAAARAKDPAGASCFCACAADLVSASFLDTSLEDWARINEINVLGVVRGIQTLMPAMLERGGGSIAVVCSVNSFFAEADLSAYSTSKAALLQVVRSAALEYAQHGMRINAVCPGAIDTALFRRALAELDDPAAVRRAVAARTPNGRILDPSEVAAVIRFLLSDEASGLSGAAITVDGGLTSTYDFAVDAGAPNPEGDPQQ